MANLDTHTSKYPTILHCPAQQEVKGHLGATTVTESGIMAVQTATSGAGPQAAVPRPTRGGATSTQIDLQQHKQVNPDQNRLDPVLVWTYRPKVRTKTRCEYFLVDVPVPSVPDPWLLTAMDLELTCRENPARDPSVDASQVQQVRELMGTRQRQEGHGRS